MAPIAINGITFDPVADAGVMRALSLEASDASQSKYILVGISGSGITTPQQDAELERLGLKLHGYVAQNTYLFEYEPSDLDVVRNLDFVEWANVFMKHLKVNPALRRSQGSNTTDHTRLLVLAVDPATSGSGTKVMVDAVLHKGVNPASDELLNTVSGRARIPRDEVIVCRHKLRLSTETRNLGDLADIDGIRAILPVEKPQLHNNVARNILNANVDINGTSYQGDGQTVCVADTGFDVGSTDPAVMHPAFIGRVAHLYDLGGRGKSSDPEGHGTHVAGSVLGNGSSKTMGDAIQGTAPQATLVVQSAYQTSFKDLGGLPADLNDLFQPPYDDYQVRIHTNSWGFGVGVMGRQRPYNFSSAAFELDEFVWEHKDMVICFAAGNDGTDVVGPDGISDVRQVGAVAAAKNCITVGASESIRLEHRPRFATYGDLRPASYPRDPLHSDQMSNNAEGMAAFSSRGKTAENRVKPDVVAPGTSILSARSRAAGSAPNDFGTSSDPDWWFDSGTSMATPLVAGCAAVVRETLVKNGRPQPSAALIKALLINGAVDLTGQYNRTEAKRAPNDDAGWGRVNLAASIIIPGPGSPAGGDDIPPLNKGDPPVVITVPIPEGPPNDASTEDASGIRTFKVTLVWTDPPELNGKLQNNLDLVVIASNGLERFGNMGTAKGSDSINNVEQVVWENIPAGDAQIVVRPTAIRVDSQPSAYAWRLSW